MLQYIRYFILVFGLLIIAFACNKDWLDEKPDVKLVVPATFRDFQGLLDNVDIMNLGSPALQEAASDDHYITDAIFNARSNEEKNAYTWSYSFPYNFVPDWDGTYKSIFYANIVIEGLSKVTPKSDVERSELNSIMGQALFQRARGFYELLQLFAPTYTKGTETSEFGIVLKLESDINIVSKRSNLKDCYNQVISDLVSAKNLLPDNALYITRASKTAAFAMLARVCLAISDYEQAFKFADSTLARNNKLIDYNTINAGLNIPIPQSNDELIFYNCLIPYRTINPSTTLVDPILYSSYTSNDLRKTIFFRINTDGSVRFKGTYDYRGLVFGGLATDEIYLIRAECLAREGKVAEAMIDLNYLLKKRWKTGTFAGINATTKMDAINIILLERKKELLMRGIRWSDIRRLNKDVSTATTIKRVVSGITYTIEPNSYKYSFPIPDYIINMTSIQQNAGW